MKFLKTYSVRSSEITPDYHLKKIYIGMYFQECFAEYTASKKLAAYDIAKMGLTWLTSDVKVEYTSKMPFWRDNVDMQVWVREVGAARMYVDFEAFSKGKTIAKGSSIQLVADNKNHKIQKISDIASRFPICEQSILSEENFGKISPIKKSPIEISQVVRFDDLDFNMHLNNVRYIPRGLEAIPSEYRNNHRLISYKIKYLHETFFNNTVVSQAFIEDNRIFHKLLRQEDGIELSQMETIWEEISQ